MTSHHIRFSAMAIASLMMAGFAVSAAAHHSFAMFDDKHEVTLDATVQEFQWTNPHMWIELVVVENGQPVRYSIEGGPPLVMGRKGWSRVSFKPGDKVQMTIHPTKDTSLKSGAFVRAVFEDGHKLEGRF